MVGAGYGQMGRVLIVDDDPMIGEILAHILGEAGLEAVCVQSDSAAYPLIPTLPTFRALIVDVDLRRGTTAFELARFARQVIPGLLVIYMSGEAVSVPADAPGAPAGAFLQKPFAAGDLLRMIEARPQH